MLLSKYTFVLLFVCVISFSFSGQSIFGQVNPTPTPCPITDSNCSNGIGVSDMKVFDNRSLTLQLEGLEKILQQLNVIDQKSLTDSLGLSQGYQSRDVSRSLDVGTPPIPGVTTTRKPDANSNLNISEETTTKKEISATPPALPDLIAAPNNSSKYGTQSEDLLSQEIDLTYKIFNLRMLLERSLTDRLKSDGSGSKLQTVLGFKLAFDPQKVSKDMAAFVELTVTASDGTPVSVVSMMPEEKTYNTSALSTKSNAFGGSAVFKVITVGYSERRRGQTFYVYQDSDTLTYQGMNPDSDNSKSPTFGWEFRPVLGRRSVATDPRNLFAVLSIDKRDLVNISESTNLTIKIHTYWKKYDHKTLTVDNAELYPRSPKDVNASVFSTAKYQTGLSPKINNVKWNQLDDKTGVISVEGENFFDGTSLLIGNTVLDNPTNGLTIKSDQSMQIRTTFDALGAGEVVLNGRYGNTDSIIMPSKNNVKGIAIDSLSAEPLSDKTTMLKIKLKNKELDNLSSVAEINDMSRGQLETDSILGQELPPIILIGNLALPTTKDSFQSEPCIIKFYKPDGNLLTKDGQSVKDDKSNLPQKDCVLLTAYVPSSLLKEDNRISFRIPFMGADWYATRHLYYELQPSNVKLSKLNEDAGKSVFSITGTKLTTLTVNSSFVKPIINTDNLITFELTDAQIAAMKNIILTKKGIDPIVLEIPDSMPKPPKPTITDTNISQIFVNSSKTVTFKGEGLDQIKLASFEDKNLQIFKQTKKEITILLTRDVTKEAGEIEIILKKDINDKEPAIGKVLILDKSKETKQ